MILRPGKYYVAHRHERRVDRWDVCFVRRILPTGGFLCDWTAVPYGRAARFLGRSLNRLHRQAVERESRRETEAATAGGGA